MGVRSVLIGAAALGMVTAAAAQQPAGQRITGALASATAGELVITTASGPVHIALSPQTRILLRQAAKPEDIVAGAYLGTANQSNADGSSGVSTEVHLMDDGLNVNAPMNGSGLMMTNGHVKTVRTTKDGRELEIDYGQASTRRVVAPAGTPITRMKDVQAADLAAGEEVMAMAAPGADGKPVASFVVAGPPAGR